MQVIATPYNTSLDHLRVADETQFKYDRCLRSLGPEVGALPCYGVGHSLGATLQLLISSRYAVTVSAGRRAGPGVLGGAGARSRAWGRPHAASIRSV